MYLTTKHTSVYLIPLLVLFIKGPRTVKGIVVPSGPMGKTMHFFLVRLYMYELIVS